MPKTSFEYAFTAGLMQTPELIRNLAVVGHLQVS